MEKLRGVSVRRVSAILFFFFKSNINKISSRSTQTTSAGACTARRMDRDAWVAAFSFLSLREFCATVRLLCAAFSHLKIPPQRTIETRWLSRLTSADFQHCLETVEELVGQTQIVFWLLRYTTARRPNLNKIPRLQRLAISGWIPLQQSWDFLEAFQQLTDLSLHLNPRMPRLELRHVANLPRLAALRVFVRFGDHPDAYGPLLELLSLLLPVHNDGDRSLTNLILELALSTQPAQFQPVVDAVARHHNLTSLKLYCPTLYSVKGQIVKLAPLLALTQLQNLDLDLIRASGPDISQLLQLASIRSFSIKVLAHDDAAVVIPAHLEQFRCAGNLRWTTASNSRLHTLSVPLPELNLALLRCCFGVRTLVMQGPGDTLVPALQDSVTCVENLTWMNVTFRSDDARWLMRWPSLRMLTFCNCDIQHCLQPGWFPASLPEYAEHCLAQHDGLRSVVVTDGLARSVPYLRGGDAHAHEQPAARASHADGEQKRVFVMKWNE